MLGLNFPINCQSTLTLFLIMCSYLSLLLEQGQLLIIVVYSMNSCLWLTTEVFTYLLNNELVIRPFCILSLISCYRLVSSHSQL